MNSQIENRNEEDNFIGFSLTPINIFELRDSLKRRYKLNNIASEIGLSYSQLWRCLNGKSEMSITLYNRLIKYLE